MARCPAMPDRRRADRRTNPAIPEPLERKKDRRQEDRRESLRRPATLVVREGRRSETVVGELGLGGASFSLSWAPSGPVTIDHPDTTLTGLAATVTTLASAKGAHEVHVVLQELDTSAALALAKWLDEA